MSKKLLIAVGVILVAGGLLYFKASTKQVMVPAGSDGTVTYKCDANKSFALRYVSADTVRVEGPGVTSAALKENVAGYWVSTDGKTTVKTVGSYVVLVQNDKVTHDRCAAMK